MSSTLPKHNVTSRDESLCPSTAPVSDCLTLKNNSEEESRKTLNLNVMHDAASSANLKEPVPIHTGKEKECSYLSAEPVMNETGELETIGTQLLQCGQGGSLNIGEEENNCHLFYLGQPNDSLLVRLQPGTILLCNSTLLRGLCEVQNRANGIEAQWTCQTKDCGRLNSVCTHSGFPRKARGVGVRVRTSKKVGCSASVTTVQMTQRFSKKEARTALVTMRTLAPETFKEMEKKDGLEVSDFCVVRKVQLHHTGHMLEPSLRGVTTVSRRRDVLNNAELLRALVAFRRVCPGGRGSYMKAERYLRERFPQYKIPCEVLQNAIKKLAMKETDAADLIAHLKHAKEIGEIEYLDYTLENETRVLTSVTWAYAGATKIVQRCGDLMFWDSTHNTTSYEYKLATITVVDSEGSSRAVLLSITLQESEEYCKRLLASWHEAFDVCLPPVIFTDGDDAMALAISSVPYSSQIHHLLCLYHLFDMNVKKKVRPALTSAGGAFAWSSFRRSLSVCRDAVSESTLFNLWGSLLQEWLPPSARNAKARNYLQSYVWSRREKWACVYFKEKLTLGAMSTQRAESWNSLLRCFADKASLTNYEMSIRILVNRQSRMERKASSFEWRTVPLMKSPKFLRKRLIEVCGDIGCSRFACEQLCYELNEAQGMTFVTDVKHEEVAERNEQGPLHVRIHGMTSRIYVNDDDDETNSNLRSETKVEFSIKIVDNGMHEKTHDIEVLCECLYNKRMGIPCRHLLAASLHMDRTKHPICEPLLAFKRSSVFEALCTQTVSVRWISQFRNHRREVPRLLSNRFIPQIQNHEKASEQELDSWLLECGVRKEFPAKSQTRFPHALEDEGDRKAFALIRSVYNRIAENVSSNAHALPLGALIYELGVRMEHATRNCQTNSVSHYMASTENVFDCLHTMVSDVIRDVRDGSTVTEHTRKQNQQIKLAFDTVSMSDDSETYGQAQLDTVERSKDSSRPQNSEEHSMVQSEGSRESSLSQIMNPVKRHDYRKANRNAAVMHKTRPERRSRQEKSRRLRASFREANNSARIISKPKTSGYACPLCTEIGIQNNPANVRQHFVHKHWNNGNGRFPKIADMPFSPFVKTGSSAARRSRKGNGAR